MPALPELLGRSLAAFAGETSAAGVTPPFRLPLWANVVRVLDVDGGDPLPQRELPTRARISRRALAPTLTNLGRWGWIAVEGPARRKVVRLTTAGQAAADAWRPVPSAVESRWRADIGAGRVDRLRRALVALVGRLPLELPHYPATYGHADRTVAGTLGVDVVGPGPFRPGVDHGADWRPVRRTASRGTEAADALPVYALLSQAFVAFAMSYEARSSASFEVTYTVVRHVADGGTPLAAPQFPSGLPRAAAYPLRRHALASVDRDPSTGTGVIRLTPRGRACRDTHAALVAAVTESWCAAYGRSTIGDLAAAAGAVCDALPRSTSPYPPDV